MWHSCISVACGAAMSNHWHLILKSKTKGLKCVCIASLLSIKVGCYVLPLLFNGKIPTMLIVSPQAVQGILGSTGG